MMKRISFRRATAAALVLAVAGVMACEKKDADDEKLPLGAGPAAATEAGAPAASAAEPVLTAESKAQLDTGNAAFRRKDFKAARAAYEKAAAGSPDHAAPWFGLSMVAKATNDTKLGESALAEISKRNQAPPVEHTVPDSAAMKKAHAKAGVGETKS